MPKRAITIEEYYLAREKLKDMSQEAIKARWRKILRFIGIKTSWHQFLEYGYFTTFLKHPLDTGRVVII